ncbi:MAG TPA: M12 family metallo-peptidase [Blastocatellia bacterium]|nr:M12 family metallo-peptidase [Blastocatellia bacterium]
MRKTSNHQAAFHFLPVIIFIAGLYISITATPKLLQTGAASFDGVWHLIDESSIAAARSGVTRPASYSTFRLSAGAIEEVLNRAPAEFTRQAKDEPALIALAMPDGSFQRFRIEYSPVMEPALAAVFPYIKSFRAQGIDDPTATARFDWTPLGFHAIVISSRGAVYISPYSTSDLSNYISYYLHDLRDGYFAPQCLVDDALQAASDLQNLPGAEGPNLSSGTTLRNYRLAIGTTVEYTNNSVYGGGKTATLTKLATIVNLINAIYERETAIHFNLVADQLNIIFDAEPDGYTNGNVISMLNENPGVLNSRLPGGASSYDFGHVFGLGSAGSSSGAASVGVVCGSSTNKGAAASVLGIALVTGNFSIDSNLLAHEFGHQFNARHTFNSTSNLCGSPGQRNSATAYEPGSGSTLMAYPGICSPENLQSNSDPYFHGASFDQIVGYSVNSGTCATTVSTGNNPPVVNAGPDYTIPVNTPFALTATGSDPDGDALTYCWEEFDLGSASPPLGDNGTRPLFRSFTATTNPTRIFPKLTSILSGTASTGESMPITTRALNFRVTVRDNRAGGGAVASDAMQVSVTATSGPFLITSPNSSVSWTAGSLQSVSWDTANSSSPPVSCSSVKISLSTDGGLSFPVTIAASTPNDGSHSFSVPNTLTSSARIKVEALSNIFFDISNSNFSITAGCPTSISSTTISFAAAGGNSSFDVTAAGGCSWTATTNNPDFIEVTSGAGTGNGQVSFSVSENSASVPRAGTITIGGHTMTVMQGAAFLDVGEEHVFYTEIGKLSARGVTLGCGGGNYCPDMVVTRDQMAAFIIRALGETNPPEPAMQRYADVPATNVFYRFIEEMAVRQITLGCGGGNYCPGEAVLRDQMGGFIIRALHEPGYIPPEPAMQRFMDVGPGNVFYRQIEEMAVRGITLGCGGGNYCPGQAVTRGQMAAFLVRAFNL